jgi:riboflavin kinase/FMN adenylyltransferase
VLARGDFQTLRTLLGHAYTVTGRVIHGAKQGRLLGFPTMNIVLRRKMVIHGVYVVKIQGLNTESQAYYGVANVGRRPTINPLMHPLLEVFVFDWQGDAYGKRLNIEFLSRLRDEQKFISLDALKVQVKKDVEQAKKQVDRSGGVRIIAPLHFGIGV